MKTLQAQHVLVKQVPVKRLQVSYVKDDAMALWNGPFVEGL
jgi:hypothetical protein